MAAISPGVFPDYPAPVVRNSGGELEMTMMRWGMPPPPRAGGYPVTNIRNTASPHWRRWLSAENRPVSFGEIASLAAHANHQTSRVSLGLLHGRTSPMRVEGFRAGIDLVQHDRVGLFFRQKNIEYQGAGFGSQATLTVSFQVFKVFVALPRSCFDGCYDCKFGHVVCPSQSVT
jgi:hypothetical protein